MAGVVLGGLVSCAFLNLFAIPPLYLRFGSSPEPVLADVPQTPYASLQYAAAGDAAD
jgi:hypothetical protein